jgi:hypothetical protein
VRNADSSWVPQMCIVEGKSYSEAEAGDITESFLDANTLLVDAKGKAVLAPGKASEKTADHRIVASFRRGKVIFMEIPDHVYFA